ncbi:MAG: 1-acyl-sn-glycerol-3-phosphate acyltransferase [Planctomycetes bacterium]|nr:1-acyl-sn-glycerol-3-phosphate acyltransferase [Planctomycetota bacterium]
MLDLARLRNVRLHRIPPGQRLIAEFFLRWAFVVPRRTRIVLEGAEFIPRDRPVFFAMNHTDRYNYWPLQYALYRLGGLRYTATWVKGKYYEHPLSAFFMSVTNNIPVPSRGYVLAGEFRRAIGRRPTDAEYRELRGENGGAPCDEVRRFRDSREFAGFEDLFTRMMAEVTRLNREAVSRYALNVLVFPQGTRSIRLSRGHPGLAQMTQHLGVPIVPVGCSGSDRIFPGPSPYPQGGRVVYRIGAPLEPDGPEIGAHRVREPFVPFTRSAEPHRTRFAAITDAVMERINALVDPRYRFGATGTSDGVSGMGRFF